ncbi:MAG: hypothetical protein FP816_13205 [Desulfobacteraceae bacterium]|nr:hypothetical protein [Desulfobacteraceae bacterium]MBU4001987.1 hypothetical protein [Pseudomonadota bacterium]
MRKSILFILMAGFFVLVSTTFAAEEMKSHDMQMPDTESPGKLIRDAAVDGYHLSYRLIDLQAQVGTSHQGMDMKGMGTHHLMLGIQDANEKTIDSAKVGYLIIGPDGVEQKVMTMGMSGAYGGDINLSQPGEYTIKCKAVFGEQKLLDDFKYTL